MTPPHRPTQFTSIWSIPPVTQPDQALPDVGPFLRVFAGTDEPATTLLRYAREYIGIWQHIYEHGPNTSGPAEEHLTLLTWLIDRDAGGHTKEIAFQSSTPVNPSSYGEMVAWLAWKYLLVALRKDQPAHADRDAAALAKHIEAFDQLVADVRAGRVRLPDNTTGVFPPKTVTPQTGSTP